MSLSSRWRRENAGVAAVKYVGLGLVLLGYAAAFRDVNATFNAFADFIANNATSGTDIFSVWMSDLQTHFHQYGYRAFWDLVGADLPASLEACSSFSAMWSTH